MNLRVSILFLFFAGIGQINAQTDPEYSFSLAEAQEYALKNNSTILTSQIDLEIAKKKIWETTAIGLPQANGTLAFSHSLTEPKIAELFSGFGGDTSATNGPEFDFKNSTAVDIMVTQLIFNGAYIVGLQTTKTFKALSEYALDKSENDLIEMVTNNYFMVLILRENKMLLDSTLLNSEKVLMEMKANFKAGFIEETDIDQMEITLSRIRNIVKSLERQSLIAEKLLKFSIGMDINANISLTESLDSYIESPDFLNPVTTEFNIDNFPDFKVLKSQEKLMQLNLKLQKSNVLPAVSAFYAYHKQLNDNYVDFQPENMVGIQVTVPLFASGQNYMKIRQAKLNFEKTKLDVQTAADGMHIEFEQARFNYLDALNKCVTEKTNIETTKKIFDRDLIKYKEGFIGSMELTLSQNQYLQAQSAYFTAVGELVAAKSKIDKMTSNKN
ncbi:MAG: TolC family protein [Bacteroidales bacterium]